MKKLLSILLLFACHIAQSQTVPQGINYQAVALDQSGQPIPGIDIVGRPIDDAEIGVRISIIENVPTGNILYQEEHEVLTDLYGMFNLVIGQGLQVSVDPFSSINWQGDKFLQVELSIENDGEFVLSAVQQLMSVPYAFLAENALIAQTAIDVDDADADPSNELQSLSVSGDSLTLSNGNTVQLPAIDDADSDPNNEIQVLSISNDTLYLSNGGFAILPVDKVNDADADPSNEIQVLSISNDTLYLSNGGFAILPVDKVNDADADPSNEIQTLTKSGSTISLTNGGSVTVFDGNYNNLSNTPNIPTKTSDLTNDSGFITIEQDSSATNELQTLSISNDTIFLTNGGFVKLPSSVQNNSTITASDVLMPEQDTLVYAYEKNYGTSQYAGALYKIDTTIHTFNLQAGDRLKIKMSTRTQQSPSSLYNNEILKSSWYLTNDLQDTLTFFLEGFALSGNRYGSSAASAHSAYMGFYNVLPYSVNAVAYTMTFSIPASGTYYFRLVGDTGRQHQNDYVSPKKLVGPKMFIQIN